MLVEIVRKRRIKKRRLEIAHNAAETLEAVQVVTAKRGSVADLLADDVENDCLVVRSAKPRVTVGLKSSSEWQSKVMINPLIPQPQLLRPGTMTSESGS